MKKAISILLCLCLALSVFTVVPFAASAAEVTEESVGATSGTTVDCTWALDDNDTLTISGYGAMGDYSSQKLNGTWITTAPWGANIKTVIIEDGVTYIGSYAFYGCTGLTSVTIPDSVTSIGSNSFYGCTGLTSITIPDSLANIEGDAFNNTAWYNNQPDGMVYAGRVAYKYKGTMPDNTSIIIRDGTKRIAGYAFRDCTGLTSVTIPDSVTSIGGYAFYECTGLTSVTIGNSVTIIGYSAFGECTGLTSVTIPDSVTSIGGYAFEGTTWANNQPDGVVYAGRVAYGYKGTMPDNTSIIIRDGTKGIAGSAFERCNGLRSVIIPDSVTSIGFGSLGYNWGRKKIDGLTIYGVPGSAAEQYANDNGFTFIEYVDAAIGDMTGDGKVNVRDVTAMQRHLAGLEELTDDRLALADVNTDGKVTIDDVTLLQRYLAEFDVTIG